MELEITQFFINQGVAIAMLVYFILRFEKLLRANTEAIKGLELAILKGGVTNGK